MTSSRPRHLVSLAVVVLLGASPAVAGGAWVPAPGEGSVFLGFSRKTANTSWDTAGEKFDNLTTFDGQQVHSEHDFRYGYLSGEVGVMKRVSITFVGTYLHGLEGPQEELEKNTGLSDAWIGAKVQIARGAWPMALGFGHRNPVFYDLPGAYSRYVFDDRGQRKGVSPEWRGVLKHDYALSYLVSHALPQGWVSAEAGYNWRTGAPASQLFLNGEAGRALPVLPRLRPSLKLGVQLVKSTGNDTPRQPDDRFGARADGTFNFNDASMLKGSLSVFVPLPGGFMADVGFARWVWGRSARRYNEPYISLGRGF